MILLLRPFDESVKSAEALEKLNFKTTILPFSKPHYLDITPSFKEEALIFTSPRAFKNLTLPDKPIFTGKTGAELAVIINASPYKSFYWGAGSTTAFDLISACPTKQIYKQTLYEMKLIEKLEAPLPNRLTAILHYSKETLKRFIQITHDETKMLPHFCLSNRIAEGLPEGFKKLIAEKPTEQSLFSLLSDKMLPK